MNKPSEQEIQDMLDDSIGVHKIWEEIRDDIGELKQYHGKAYELLQPKLDKYVKKYPEDVSVACVDDDMFMGARIYMIRHKSPKSYFGITCIYAPQQGPVTSWFMYPSHVNSFLRALDVVKKSPEMKELD